MDKKVRTTVVVWLEVEHADNVDAFYYVGEALNDGCLQDQVEELADQDDFKVKVRSALVRAATANPVTK